jgi:hypothetical protein
MGDVIIGPNAKVDPFGAASSFPASSVGGEQPEEGYEFPPGSTPTAGATLTAIATYENISLYWPESSGSSNDECLVRYRPQGGVWRQALSLWWDGRSAEGYNQIEYRGSIVKVQEDTTYEIEVLTKTGRVTANTSVATWADPTEGTTVGMPALTNGQYNITTSGTPGAWRVYEPSGASAEISCTKSDDACIYLNASYVIIRGLTLHGAARRGVSLGPSCHHVIIEQNEIYDIGYEDPEEANLNPEIPSENFACNYSAMIGTDGWGSSGENLNIEHIVVQDNYCHSPTFDSNNWDETRVLSNQCNFSTGGHPTGTHAIYFSRPGGQLVIRYNTVTANIDRAWNDGIGGGANFEPDGNLGRDSDVYRNYVTYSWDDGLEIEGGSMNCRVYENRIDKSYRTIATACVYWGPLYIFRNIGTQGMKNHTSLSGQGTCHKMRGAVPARTDYTLAGRVYMFHNTFGGDGDKRISAIMWHDGGTSGEDSAVAGHYARNNIYDTNSGVPSSLDALMPFQYSDWDYDLSPDSALGVEEDNLEIGRPTYDPQHSSGEFTLADGSLGRNSGEVIPNFNTDYLDAGPDKGAIERGQAAIIYGKRT